MDHRAVLRRLDRAERGVLLARSDRAGLVRLLAHLGLLGTTGTGIALAPPFLLLPAMLVHGIGLAFLFAPLHETIHHTAFETRRLNVLVANACGFLLLLPPRYFHAFHMAHHRHTQDPARDPELASPRPETLKDYLFHLTGLPYWLAEIRVLLHAAGGGARYPFVEPAAWPGVVREARRFLIGYALVAALAIAAGSTAPLAYWVVPALLGQPFLRACLLAEHAACPFGPDMLKNTRTTLAGSAVRFLTWNMGFHAEHHAMPGVPFHRLPDLHRHLAPHLERTADGYPAAHREILREGVLRAG